ncbi:hypothetical protein J5N97_026849 [Dioscorea zingiberensis]|uniref:Uncharacterized protein n=1 Tax=Dioscorea zingiberensis TaxID=325984 RepID=A0A9D5C2X7_9LILI|nr:hypothetical protein J5N97_026849 [Dioscorea zingiberensis]
MAPSFDFSDWRGTPLVVTMENPNYSVLEIDGPSSNGFHSMDKGKERNAKQFTWVLLLKAHKAAGCLAWMAAALWTLMGVIRKRLIFRQGVAMESEKPGKGHLLFRIIRGFLVLSLVALAFEFVAYWNGWHFHKPELHIPQSIEIQGLMHSAYLSWLAFRASYIAYPIQLLSKFCVILFIVQSLDQLPMALLVFGGSRHWRTPEAGLRENYCEDMDIAVRAHLNGWKFIFLNDVKVLCEVPESYRGLRKQQHPMAFRPDAAISVMPSSHSKVKAEATNVGDLYIPVIMSFLNILPAPRSFPFIVPYLLFENTMSVTKFNAMVSGLFQLGSSYEWVVTKKAGRSSESDLLSVAEKDSKVLSEPQLHRGVSESELLELNKMIEKQEEAPLPAKKKSNIIYKKELALAALLLTAAVRSLLSAQGNSNRDLPPWSYSSTACSSDLELKRLPHAKIFGQPSSLKPDARPPG